MTVKLAEEITTEDPTGLAKTDDTVDSSLEDPTVAAAKIATDTDAGPGDPPEDPVDFDGVMDKVTSSLGRRRFTGKGKRKSVQASMDQLLTLNDAQMGVALGELAAKGYTKRLFKHLPKDYYTSKREDMFRLYKAAPPEVLIDRAQDLLKLKFFDWKVSKGDAEGVVDILSVLPPKQFEAFLYMDGGRWYDTLMAAAQKHGLVPKPPEEPAPEETTKEVEPAGDATKTADPQKAVTDVSADAKTESSEATKSNKEDKPGFFKRVKAGAKVLGGLPKGEVDFDDVETVMGGDVAGVKFDESKGNKVDVDFSWSKGLLELDLPSLGIESVERDGIKVGASTVKGLNGKVKWATEEDGESYTSFDVASLDLGTVNVVTSSGSFELSSVVVTGLALKGETPPIVQKKPIKRGEAFKLIGNQIGELIGLNLPAFKAVAGGDYTKPETLADRMASNFNSTMDVNFTIQSIKLGAVKQNGEQVVSNVELKGFSTVVEDTLVTTHIAKKIAALEAKKSRTTEEETQLSELKKQKDELTGKLPRLKTLEDKCEKGTLSRKEQDELITLRDELKVATATIKITSLEVNDVNAKGQKVDQLAMKGFETTVTGGELEKQRNLDTSGDKLKAIMHARNADKVKAPTKDIEEMEISGGFKELKATGVDADFSKLGKGYEDYAEYGTLDGNFSVEGAKFAMKGDDVTAGADKLTTQKFNSSFAGVSVQDATVNNAKLGMNMETGAMSMSSGKMDAHTIDYAGEATVGSAYASGFNVTMDAAGNMTGGVQGIDAYNVDYLKDREGAVALKRAEMEDMKFGMGTDEKGTEYMNVSGSGIYADGIDYQKGTKDAMNIKHAAVGGFNTTMSKDAKGNESTTFDADCMLATDITGMGATVKSAEVGKLSYADAQVDEKTQETFAKVGVTDLNLKGVDYKDGVDAHVNEVNAESIGLNMYDESGAMSGTVKGAGVKGASVTSDGKKTSVSSATLGKLDFAVGGEDANRVSADIDHLAVRGINDENSGAKVRSVNADGISYNASTVQDGKHKGKVAQSATVKQGIARGIKHADTKTDVDAASLYGLNYSSVEGGATQVDVGAVAAWGAASSGSRADKVGVKGIHLTQDGDDMKANVGSVNAQGLTLMDGAYTAESANLKGVAANMRDGVTSASIASGGITDLNATDGSLGVKSASMENIAATLGDEKGTTVTAGALKAEGLNYTSDDLSADVAEASATGVYANLDDNGNLLAKVDQANTGLVEVEAGPHEGNIGSSSLTDLRLAASGLNEGGTFSLDAASAGNVTLKDLSGKADAGALLSSALAPSTETKEETTDSGETLSLDGLSGSSGTISLKVPIDIDLSDYYLGAIKLDLQLTVKIADGKIDFNSIDVDFDWLETVAATIGHYARFRRLVKRAGGGLTIESVYPEVKGTKLHIAVEIGHLFGTNTFSFGVWDGAEWGLGEGGGGGSVDLETLFEKILNEDPEPELKSSKMSSGGSDDDGDAPLTEAELCEKLEAVESYVNLGDMSFEVKEFQLQDGRMGTDSTGMTLTDSGDYNNLNFSISGDDGMKMSSRGIHATDLNAAGATADRLEIDDISAGSTSTLDVLKSGKGSVGGTIGRVSVDGAGYGDSEKLDDKHFPKKK